MPTYEYHCDACNHNFDEFQAMTAKRLKKCPKCGKLKLRQVFGTGAAVIFKGSGFYQTDYRSESYKASAKAEESAKNDAAGKSDSAGKTESKGSATTSAPAKEKSSKSKAAASDD
jgi:putative FmdB family regulatory protein